MAEVQSASPPQNPLVALGSWFRRPTNSTLLEVLLVALLATLTLVYRTLHLEPVEIGGDALKVWEFGRRLAGGMPLPHHFDHHTARFGLVLPVLMTQWVGGSEAPIYFAAPLLVGVLLHLSVYGIARQVSGRLAGVVAVGLLLAAPQMVRPSSQILPELFGPAYACFALFAALCFNRASTRRRKLAWLSACGLGLFFAYGAKIPYLYFAPGCALIVWLGQGAPPSDDEARVGRWQRSVAWLRRHNLLDPLLLTALVVGLLVLESVFYLSWTKHSSQLSVVNATHGVSHQAAIHSASDLFAIYRNSEPGWLVSFAVGIAATLGTLALGRDKRSILVVITLGIYLCLHTFVLRKLNPPIPWTRPHPRYLLAILPLLAVIAGVFTQEALLAIGRRVGAARGRAFRLWLRPATPLVLVLGMLVSTWSERDALWNSRNGFVQAKNYARLFTEAFERGIPIASSSPGAKPLRAVGGLFVSPRVWRKDDAVASSGYFASGKPKYRYHGRDVRAPGFEDRLPELDAEVVRRMRAKRCVIMLVQRNRHFSGAEAVARNCQGLAASLQAAKGS